MCVPLVLACLDISFISKMNKIGMELNKHEGEFINKRKIDISK